MALFECLSCNKIISDRGNYCPYCGISIKKNNVESNKNANEISLKEVKKDKQKFVKNNKCLGKSTVKNDNSYIVDYINENEFKKKERTVRKYNMLAYKKLLFDYYPSLREGKFLGDLISSNKNEGIYKYELPLPTDKMFVKVHGKIILHYTVYEKERVVMLETLTPEDVLTEEHPKELTTYKGVMVSKSHKDLDMFKINLLNSMKNDGFK